MIKESRSTALVSQAGQEGDMKSAKPLVSIPTAEVALGTPRDETPGQVFQNSCP